jgi:hypothetical protein
MITGHRYKDPMTVTHSFPGSRRSLPLLLAFTLSSLAACGGSDEGVATTSEAAPASAATDADMAAAAAQDDLDVLKVIPENYTLLIERDRVRVIEARIPPGTEEPLHRHLSGVSVPMTAYVIEHRPEGATEWTRSERQAGAVYLARGASTRRGTWAIGRATLSVSS